MSELNLNSYLDSCEEAVKSCGYCGGRFDTTWSTFLNHVHRCEVNTLNAYYGEEEYDEEENGEEHLE